MFSLDPVDSHSGCWTIASVQRWRTAWRLGIMAVLNEDMKVLMNRTMTAAWQPLKTPSETVLSEIMNTA